MTKPLGSFDKDMLRTFREMERLENENAKLRKVVEFFRENHYCEFIERGVGPCGGCDVLRELDEADK